MATEDLTTYTEVDPNSRITVTADRSSVAGLTRNEDAYLYKDKGVDHFDGNFEHLIDIRVDTGDDVSLYFPWLLANLVDERKGIIDANGDLLNVMLYVVSSTRVDIYIHECIAGTVYGSSGYIGAFDTTYYLKIKRDEGVGTYGTLYCYIYSDEARTSLLDTLTLTLHEKEDFRYIYAANTYNDANAAAIIGWCEDLDLQEGGETHEASATLSGEGTLAAAAINIVEGSASLAGAGTMTAAAIVTQIHETSATFTGAGNLSASALCILTGGASLGGAGELVAAAKVIRSSSATLEGQGSLTAAAKLTLSGAATLSGSGTLSVSASITCLASATCSGTGSLSASAKRTRAGAATFSGVGSLSASALCGLFGSASLGGVGSLQAAAKCIYSTGASLAGVGSLTCSAVSIVTASASLSGVGTLTAAGTVGGILEASASLTGEGTLAVSVKVLHPHSGQTVNFFFYPYKRAYLGLLLKREGDSKTVMLGMKLIPFFDVKTVQLGMLLALSGTKQVELGMVLAETKTTTVNLGLNLHKSYEPPGGLEEEQKKSSYIPYVEVVEAP